MFVRILGTCATCSKKVCKSCNFVQYVVCTFKVLSLGRCSVTKNDDFILTFGHAMLFTGLPVDSSNVFQ